MTKIAAVILAAGFGGRFLPASKSINKCMMPVNGTPVLQHVVQECVDAGIDKIVIVVPSGDTSCANHFMQDPDLQRKLIAIHKGHLYDAHISPMQEYADRLEFVEQPTSEDYGTTVALRPALNSIDDSYSHVFILNGDGFISNGKKVYGEARSAIQVLQTSQSDGLLFGVPCKLEDRSSYGVLIQSDKDPTVASEIVEKPDDTFSPESLLINMGWYILPRAHLEAYIKGTKRNPADNEFNIVWTINEMMEDHTLSLYAVKGTYLDCGTPASWLAANNYLAKLDG